MTTDARGQGKESAPKAKVFISYSRKDIAFADRLETALKARGFEPLIDRKDIWALEKWWEGIQSLIAEADTIVFVLSPDTVTSTICAKEIDYAASLNKRFVPIVYRPVEDRTVPEPLRRLNFLFFDDVNRFEANADQLVAALNTDIEWIKRHTRFGEQARQWDSVGRPNSHGLLLRPPMLEEAEAWLTLRPRTAPEPTEAIRRFIAASRTAFDQDHENARELIKLRDQLADIQNPPTAAHIFISYSHHDETEALEILHGIESANIKCWISSRDVPRGEDFQDSIVSALEQASAMVLVFSKNADDSKEIKKELALASEHGLFVLPVRIEDVEPTKGFKYQLAIRQRIDLFKDREQNMALIVDALRKHLRTSTKAN
jgi:hypothetical protein